jgi:hypothetical protein
VVRQRIANPLYVGSNPIRTSSEKTRPSAPTRGHVAEGGRTGVCTPVCSTPLEERELEAAIATVTRALAAAEDHELAAELVIERRALRSELQELRASSAAGVVVRLDTERKRSG